MIRLTNIEAERSRNNMSRADFSKKLGVSTTTYKRYVDGISPIPSDKLIFMAHMFKCSSDYLLGLSDTKGGNENAKSST